jgi:pimeloyl-ACP methyl ester carboxylesterase
VSGPAIRYARNGDVSIAYMVHGDGPLDLLFVGGFISHLEVAMEWEQARRFWDRLGSFARVIAFDKRGMGLSDRDGGGYTLENVVDDALAVLDAAGAARAGVFGVSEGGSAATLLAALHPDRIGAMVQFATYPRLSQAPNFPEGIPVPRLRGAFERMVAAWGDPASIDQWAPSVAADPEAREWWGRMLRFGGSPANMRAIAQMYEELDVRPVLPTVTVPTLVLFRAGDRVVPPRLSRLVARGIPGARAVELPGDDHLFCAGDQPALLDEVEEFLTGRPAVVAGDRVLATVLFTDIVGSTDHAARLGDRGWREVLAQHDRLVGRELGRQRGRLVTSAGDGTMATFDGPARAVRAALAIREACAALGLEMRAGVHTGECELMGDAVTGMAVHLAARVEASAAPGEVLTSGTVKDLVVGSGLEFESRGVHVLKGVPGEWPLYAVRGDAERARAA